MYELAVEPEKLAKAYIQRFYHTASYVTRITPKSRVMVKSDEVVFKFTGIGQKWTHHIYVYFKPVPSKKAGVFSVLPPYPMYLFAVMSPFSVASFPAVIMRVGNEVRGVLVENLDDAISSLAEAMTKYKLIEPSDFTKDNGVAFEGILYDTPAGYVAFLSDKEPFKMIDVIEGHVEDDLSDDNVMYPHEFLADWIHSS